MPRNNNLTAFSWKSPEPTAVGACQFRCRGSRRESAVAQLFSLGLMRTLLFIVALIVVLFVAWTWPRKGSGGPRYGSVPIHQGTPSSSIYLGLEVEHEQALYDVITRYGQTNGIQRCKSYLSYSGPPLATFTGDRIAIFVRSRLTKDCATMQERGVIAGRGIDFLHWPTNGSRVIHNGHSIQMPFTGIVWVSPFGTNYSTEEFRRVSDGLTIALRSAFTNRTIDAFFQSQ